MAGPSVFPEVPAGAANRLGLWRVSADPAERNRRSVYVFVRRNNRYAMLEPFDMPDTLETCARRNITTTPLQALTLLNSELTLDWARHFAARVLHLAGADRAAQIHHAYRLAYSRPPTPRETEVVNDFFDRHSSLIADRLATNEPVPLPPNLPENQNKSSAATLVDLCHALLNSNEFVYRN
jgi:hypothetical protein